MSSTVDIQSRVDAYYHPCTCAREEASDVPLRLVEAWIKHDAEGVANVFTEDQTLTLPSDVVGKGGGKIRAFIAAVHAGPFKGSGVICIGCDRLARAARRPTAVGRVR